MKNTYNQHKGKKSSRLPKFLLLPSLIMLFVIAFGSVSMANGGPELTGTSICTTSGSTAIGLSQTQANLYHALYRYDGMTYYRVAVYFNVTAGPAISFGTFSTVGEYVGFTTLDTFIPEASFTVVSGNYTPIPGSVDIFAMPVADAGSGGDECGLDFVLGAVSSVGTGTWTYTGPGTATFNPDANAPGATATVTAYGAYDFTWTEVNGLCSDNDFVTVNFYQQPVANAGTGGDAACDALTFQLSAVTSVPGPPPGGFSAAYTPVGNGWSYSGPGMAFFTPDEYAPNAMVTVSAYGTYTFTWTETNGPCSDFDAVTVDFYENIIADAGVNDLAACGTKTYLLDGNPAFPGQGTWTYSGPGMSTANFVPDANTENAEVTVSDFGLYTFTWTIVNGNCTDNAIVNILFPETPTATLSAVGSTHICIGSSATLSIALTGTPPWEVTYTDGTTPVTVQNILTSPYEFYPAPSSVTTYTVSNVTDANMCSSTGTGSVRIYPGTITEIGAPAGGPPCIGSNVVIPVKVYNFDDVGAISLTLNFDPVVLTYVSGSSAFPAFSVFYNPLVPGVLKMGGFDSQSRVLPDGSTLFNLTFTYNSGTSALAWDNSTPDACEYASFETGIPFCDTPASTYYLDGSVTGHPRVSAILTGTATVCDLSNTDLTLDFTGTAPWTYSINSGTPVTTSNNPETVPVLVNGTTIYVITSLNDANCTALPADYAGFVTVTANPLPDAPAGTDVTVVYDAMEHTGSATAPAGSSVIWYTTETGTTTSTAPALTDAGSVFAWAESVDDITGCKSSTRTKVTVTISQKEITGSFTVDAFKVYDGGTLANVLTRELTGVIFPDDVVLSGGTANYDDKNVGTGKTVTLTGMVLSGPDAANYSLISVATTTADINALDITGSFTVPASKPYDGNTSAVVLTQILTGTIPMDDVSLTGGVADYDTKDAGVGKTVTLTGYALSGTDAGNYNLTSVSTTTADITVLGISGFVTVEPTKVYDAGTLSNVLTQGLTGVIAPDDVALSGGTANYDNKNIGTGKTVTLTGWSLTGADAGNYSISDPTTTADITALDISGNFTVPASKPYDGGTSATVLTRTLNGAIVPDDVSLAGGIANYDTKDVGTGKTVTLTGYALAGLDAGNYNLTGVATTTADITALGIAGNITVDPAKVYDAGTLANVLTRTLTGVIVPDDVTLTGGVANYDDKNVGTGKPVTLTGWSLTGVDAGNYSIADPTTTADITALGITGSFTIPSTRAYDGTTVAEILTAPLVGVIVPDDVTLTGNANYDTKHFGTGKTVTFSSPVLIGTDAGNYTVAIAPLTTTASITKKNIIVTAVTDTKVYDGGVSSSGIPIKGTLMPGDYTLVEPTQVFLSKTVGVNKAIRASGWVIFDGNGGANYSISYTFNLTGVITALGITGNFTVEPSKIYDGGTLATVLTRSLTGVLVPDVVTLTGGDANYDNKNVGTGKTVTLTGATLTGAAAGNYSLLSVGTTTADITTFGITPVVAADNKCYDGTTTATLNSLTLTGVIGMDVVTLLEGSTNFDDANPGTGKTVTATGLTLGGADGGNYHLLSTSATTTATIYPTPVATAAVSTEIPCFGGTATVTITPTVGTPPFEYTFNGVTNGTGVFTGISAGIDYPWSVTANTCGPATGTLTVADPAPIPLSGQVTYNNTANTPLAGVTVELKQGGITVDLATTDPGGNYTFSSVCPGTYQVVASTTAPVGGINITDAAGVNAWGIAPTTIEKVKFYAGDVVLSNRLDAADAGRIQQYFLTSGIPGWAVRGAWTFWMAGETISVNPPPSGGIAYPTVTVNPLDPPITGKNLYALVTGDFNRSYLPGPVKDAGRTVTLNYNNTVTVTPGIEFELPVYAGSAMEVGAVSLIMNYPSDKMEVTGVSLGNNPDTPMMFTTSGDELRIGWNSRMPFVLKTGEKLLTLTVKLTGSPDAEDAIRFSLANDPLNELADGQVNVIPDAVLFMDAVAGSALGIADPASSGSMTFANYPNPFTGTTTFVYTLPADGMVTIEIFDMLGNKLAVAANQVQTAGEKTIAVDAGNLKPGVYTATLRLKTAGELLTRTIKIVRNQ